MTAGILWAVVVSTSAVSAVERLDHRGAVGLLLGPSLELGEWVKGGKFDEYSRIGGYLGLSFAIGANGNELHGWVRSLSGGGPLAWSGVAGYRGYFGEEQLKTFFDLGARVDLTPQFTLGPRIGFGIQWEFSSLAGVFGGLAAHLGAGNGLRFSAEAFAGVQLRSYLFE